MAARQKQWNCRVMCSFRNACWIKQEYRYLKNLIVTTHVVRLKLFYMKIESMRQAVRLKTIRLLVKDDETREKCIS